MKKLIAYSSVAHMAFVTIGLFAFNRQGIEGGLIVMLSHGLVSGALFLCVGVVYDRLHTPRDRPLWRPLQQHAGLRPAVHALHHGLGRPARHVAASSASSWPWSAPMRPTPGSPRSPPPASSSAPPTCSGSTGGSPSAPRRTAEAAAMPDLNKRELADPRADRRGGAVDGRLSGELHRADARATSTCCSTRIERAAPPGDAQLDRRPSGARRRAGAWSGRGAPLMLHDFLLILPEEILSVGALAADAGRGLGRRPGGAGC